MLLSSLQARNTNAGPYSWAALGQLRDMKQPIASLMHDSGNAACVPQACSSMLRSIYSIAHNHHIDP